MKPKRTKFSKQQRGRFSIKEKLHQKSYRQSTFGNYSLVALENGFVTENQILSVAKSIKQFITKKNRFFFNIFPQKSFTKKATGVRIGQGKGSVSLWVALVKKGQILFELDNINLLEAQKAFKKGQSKLSIKTKIFEKKIPV